MHKLTVIWYRNKIRKQKNLFIKRNFKIPIVIESHM